jgi:hypothetical protein
MEREGVGMVDNTLLSAFAQPTLDLEVPVARRRRPEPRPTSAGVVPLPLNRGRPFDAVELARAVAAAFDGIEAVVVGSGAAPAPGVRAGDVVLVDWSGGAGALRARRDGQQLTLTVGDHDSGGGVVFAVVRQFEAPAA